MRGETSTPPKPPAEAPPASAVPVAADADGAKLSRSRVMRALWLVVAVISLGVACVGVVVPGLPSTEFVLLSAWAAARGSTRFHNWLLNHRLFGPMLRNWRDGRKVSRGAKWSASISMTLCAALMLWTIPHRIAVLMAIACMAAVQVWIWRRPEP